MFLSSGKLLTLALTALTCVSASPIALEERSSNVIIAYRTVSAKQAEEYNKYGTVVYTKNLIGKQLGEGVYTTPNRGGWVGGKDDWYCVIQADETKFNAAKKAWIPEKDGETKVWWKTSAIDDYIKTLHDTPDDTMRVSVIDGDADKTLQMVIPPKLLGTKSLLGKYSKGPLDLTASCKQKMTDLPDHTVDYKTWKNIGGTAQ
ncbi:hypothetical protein BO71DRAFT_326233 [Aspergillus ellipticus CBS 707.79]|uniref:Uncharacterized protein n=1 Tax=Aspergillus ellipticus CBS 707.79 TaxID=1448320 RepID=A0A319D9P0_9EURO|nr:hypothetical protein BO71DRAFT_326233 [Aspergillus ellipticus CBS 707.79]